MALLGSSNFWARSFAIFDPLAAVGDASSHLQLLLSYSAQHNRNRKVPTTYLIHFAALQGSFLTYTPGGISILFRDVVPLLMLMAYLPGMGPGMGHACM
jgi:hypothetical protein